MLLSARGLFNPEFSIFNEMENILRAPFGEVFEGMKRSALKAPETAPAMKTDVRKEDGLYLMEMDLPGYDKENIKVELHDGYLTVSAEQKTESEKEAEDGYVMKERHFGSCSRSFYVGKSISEEDIKAAYKDGILHLSLPSEKSLPENQPKLIEIA